MSYQPTYGWEAEQNPHGKRARKRDSKKNTDYKSWCGDEDCDGPIGCNGCLTKWNKTTDEETDTPTKCGACDNVFPIGDADQCQECAKANGANGANDAVPDDSDDDDGFIANAYDHCAKRLRLNDDDDSNDN